MELDPVQFAGILYWFSWHSSASNTGSEINLLISFIVSFSMVNLECTSYQMFDVLWVEGPTLQLYDKVVPG